MAQQFLPAREVWTRYGVSQMTLWRWLKETDFPRPIYIGRYRYWRLADLEEFESRLTDKPDAAA